MTEDQHQRLPLAASVSLRSIDVPVQRVQLLVLLLAIASGCGLLLDMYGDETSFARNAYRGADLVSVLLVVPLLLLALRSTRRGSTRGAARRRSLRRPGTRPPRCTS